MEPKISIKEYPSKIKHHIAVAKRHERAMRRVKSVKKRKRHVHIAAKHRRQCRILAKIWGQQCAWNRDHFWHVFDKIHLKSSSEELAEASAQIQVWMKINRLEEYCRKARSYDFWSCSDIVNQPKIVYVDILDEFMGAFDWENADDWTDEDWDNWEKECLLKASKELSTEDNPDQSSSQETSTIYLAEPLSLY